MNIGKHHQSLRYTCVECGISCICHTCAKLCHVGHTLIYREEIVKLEIQKYEKTNKEQTDEDILEILKKDGKKKIMFLPPSLTSRVVEHLSNLKLKVKKCLMLYMMERKIRHVFVCRYVSVIVNFVHVYGCTCIYIYTHLNINLYASIRCRSIYAYTYIHIYKYKYVHT